MLISIVVLKFESIVKINSTLKSHQFVDNESMNCKYLADGIKYVAQIWYLEVIRNTDFDYWIEIESNDTLIQFDDVIIFKGNENLKLPIPWYQNSLWIHLKDEVVIILVKQRLMMVYFLFLKF